MENNINDFVNLNARFLLLLTACMLNAVGRGATALLAGADFRPKIVAPTAESRVLPRVLRDERHSRKRRHP